MATEARLPRGKRVIVDGEDISSKVRSIKMCLTPPETSIVIELLAESVTIDANGDITINTLFYRPK